MPTYYDFKAGDDIDWGKVGKTMSEDLYKVYQTRKDTRAAIDKKNQELQDVIDAAPIGNNQTIQNATHKMADNITNAKLQWYKLMKSGQMKTSDYMSRAGNLHGAAGHLWDNIKSSQENWDKVFADVQAGKQSLAALAMAGTLKGYGQFSDIGSFIDPNTGMMYIGKYVGEGADRKIDKDSLISAVKFGKMNSQQFVKYDDRTAAKSFVDGLGEVTNSIDDLEAFYEVIDKKQGDYAISEEDKKLALGYKDAEDAAIDAMVGNPMNAASILVDNMASKYQPTFNPKDKGKKGMVYYNDEGVAELTQEQVDDARGYLRTEIRSMIASSHTSKTHNIEDKIGYGKADVTTFVSKIEDNRITEETKTLQGVTDAMIYSYNTALSGSKKRMRAEAERHGFAPDDQGVVSYLKDRASGAITDDDSIEYISVHSEVTGGKTTAYSRTEQEEGKGLSISFNGGSGNVKNLMYESTYGLKTVKRGDTSERINILSINLTPKGAKIPEGAIINYTGKTYNTATNKVEEATGKQIALNKGGVTIEYRRLVNAPDFPTSMFWVVQGETMFPLDDKVILSIVQAYNSTGLEITQEDILNIIKDATYSNFPNVKGKTKTLTVRKSRNGYYEATQGAFTAPSQNKTEAPAKTTGKASKYNKK